MREMLRHFFIPHTSNNHRAKLLHAEILLLFVIFFLLAQVTFGFIKSSHPQVLGELTDVSSQELLDLTNKERKQHGKPPLVLNDQLSFAAKLKAADMFTENYWAHNGPDGTSPWKFFKQVDYKYLYAGENLARGFATTEDVVAAWMGSPSHRENMLSSNYQDIGFAIVRGKLQGDNTILVVELFASRGKPLLAGEKDNISIQIKGSAAQSVAAIQSFPMVDSTRFSYNMTLGFLGVILAVFFVDLIVIERKKIVRIVGHNLDHVFFLGSITLFIIFYINGSVL